MGREETERRLRREQAQSLGYLLIRCGQVWNERAIARVNAQAGAPVLREGQTRLLPFLQRPGGARITELAQALGVTKQAVQPLVAELVAQRIVQMASDPNDARARRVTLTEAGLAAMHHGTQVLVQLEAELAPALGAVHRRALVAGLTRLLQLLEPTDLALTPQEPPTGARRRARRG